MSDTIEQLGQQAIQDLIANLSQAKSFSLEHAPDFCQQLLARDLLTAQIGLGVFGVLALLALANTVWLVFNCQQDRVDAGGIVVLGGTATAVACFPAVFNLLTVISITVAPKVYLVEQLMEMVR